MRVAEPSHAGLRATPGTRRSNIKLQSFASPRRIGRQVVLDRKCTPRRSASNHTSSTRLKQPRRVVGGTRSMVGLRPRPCSASAGSPPAHRNWRGSDTETALRLGSIRKGSSARAFTERGWTPRRCQDRAPSLHRRNGHGPAALDFQGAGRFAARRPHPPACCAFEIRSAPL